MKTDVEKTWSDDFAKLIGDMCCQSVGYRKEMKIEGMLVITLDEDNVLVSIINVLSLYFSYFKFLQTYLFKLCKVSARLN